jgi:hypothetical protein
MMKYMSVEADPKPQVTVPSQVEASPEHPLLGTKPVPRTIYDASAVEVFFKNFLAGVGHGLGTVAIYLVFIAVVFMVVARFVWPVVEPYVTLYKNSMESLQKFQNMMPGGTGTAQPGASPVTGWNLELLPDVDRSQLPEFLQQQQQQPTEQ